MSLGLKVRNHEGHSAPDVAASPFHEEGLSEVAPTPSVLIDLQEDVCLHALAQKCGRYAVGS